MLAGGPCAGQAVATVGLRAGWRAPGTDGWAPELWVCAPVGSRVLPGPWWRYVWQDGGYVWDGGQSRVGYG